MPEPSQLGTCKKHTLGHGHATTNRNTPAHKDRGVSILVRWHRLASIIYTIALDKWVTEVVGHELSDASIFCEHSGLLYAISISVPALARHKFQDPWVLTKGIDCFEFSISKPLDFISHNHRFVTKLEGNSHICVSQLRQLSWPLSKVLLCRLQEHSYHTPILIVLKRLQIRPSRHVATKPAQCRELASSTTEARPGAEKLQDLY